MRIFSVLFSLVLLLSCQYPPNHDFPAQKWLHRYAQQTERTDPGSWASMYHHLPSSLDSLCALIKAQLIHPMEARLLGMNLDELSKDGDTPTVQRLLSLINSMDSRGFAYEKEPADRVVVACYHHAMLLASMLRSQGVAVRMRSGFSKYYEKEYGIKFGHVICEVWDKEKGKWRLVDPDRNIPDLAYSDFEFGGQAWAAVTKRGADPKGYTSSVSDGLKGIVNLMILDASLILHNEKQYWNIPLLVQKDFSKKSQINTETRQALDKLAALCQHPDQKIEAIKVLFYETEAFSPSGIDYNTYYQIIMNRD